MQKIRITSIAAYENEARRNLGVNDLHKDVLHNGDVFENVTITPDGRAQFQVGDLWFNLPPEAYVVVP